MLTTPDTPAACNQVQQQPLLPDNTPMPEYNVQPQPTLSTQLIAIRPAHHIVHPCPGWVNRVLPGIPALLHRLCGYPHNSVMEAPEEQLALREIIAEGREIRLQAEQAVAQRASCQPPQTNCRPGWKAGAGLLLAGLSAGAAGAYAGYRYRSSTAASGGESNLMPAPETAAPAAAALYLAPEKLRRPADNQLPTSQGKTPVVVCLRKKRDRQQVTLKPEPCLYKSDRGKKCRSAALKSDCDAAYAQVDFPWIKLSLNAGKSACLCAPRTSRNIPASPVATGAPPVTARPVPITPATRLVPATSPEALLPEIVVHKRFLPALPEQPATTLPSPEPEQVQVEKLFDFSCIQQRADLSWMEILRLAGKTLQAPITTLTQEARVVYSHNIEKKGCPSPQSNQRMQEITSKIDALLSTLLTLLPGSQPLALAQQLVGPALELAADDLTGRETDLSKEGELHQQLLFMFRHTVASLAADELSDLYRQPLKAADSTDSADTPPQKNILAQRFTLYNDEVAVNIENIKYPLKENALGMLFIHTLDNYHRFIRYNRPLRHWEMVPPKESAAWFAGQLSKSRFGTRTYNLLQRYPQLKIQIAETPLPLLTLSIPGAPSYYGVYMKDFIIPVNILQINGNQVVTTHTANEPEQRVLIYNDYGWNFEQPSVTIDSYLSLLLKNRDWSEGYSKEQQFTPIAEDGLCYNRYGGKFMKYNNRYYQLFNFSDRDGYYVPGQHNIVITQENGVFTLQSATDMLFPYRNQVIEAASTLEPGEPILIEADAVSYLQRHALATNQPAVIRVGPGLFRDKNGGLIFSTGATGYIASDKQPQVVSIKRIFQSGTSPDITLWRDDNTWLRVRDDAEKIGYEYAEVTGCRRSRSPNPTQPCLPVMIEQRLDNVLSEEIRAGHTSAVDMLNTHLTEVKFFDIPLLFIDIENHKYYFLYKGHYFDARVKNAWHTSTPGSEKLVQLYSKGNFFNRKRLLATIMVNKYSDKIEIKDQATFLSEQLNVNLNVAEDYLAKRSWRPFPNMDKVEDAVEQVMQSGKMLVCPPDKRYQMKLPPQANDVMVKNNLFPARVLSSPQFSIKIFNLNDKVAGLPPYHQQIQDLVKYHIEYINSFLLPESFTLLETLRSSLQPDSTTAYLKRILNTDNDMFLSDLALSMTLRLDNIARTLKPKNIYLAAAVHNGNEEGISDSPYLTAAERHQGSVVFATRDNSGRLFINIDRLLLQDHNLQTPSQLNFVSFLLREAAHIDGMSSDLFAVASENGFYIPVADAIDNAIEAIRQKNTLDEWALRTISRTYLDNIAVYRSKADIMMADDKLAWLALHDPAYRAHLLLNSADMLALITQDLYGAWASSIARSFTLDHPGSSWSEEPRYVSGTRYRTRQNLLASGSIGTVYDLHNGYLIKDYSGKITAEYKSRLRAAINNASSMNRIYGAKSATVILHPEEDGSSTVSVRMVKIAGTPLVHIMANNDPTAKAAWRDSVSLFLNKDHNPALQLATLLKEKGIHDHDINEANLLFDPYKGFNLIDFDWVDLQPEDTPLSDEATADMGMKLSLLMMRLGGALGMEPSQLMQDLGLLKKPAA